MAETDPTHLDAERALALAGLVSPRTDTDTRRVATALLREITTPNVTTE